jgi:hypothetical protein
MYIRHNGIEQEVLLHVDEANSIIAPHITPIDKVTPIKHKDTEVEVTYPLIDKVIGKATGNSYSFTPSELLTLDTIKNYCLDNIVGTTDISFEIKLTDSLTTTPKKTLNIKQPRTHAISDDWNNLPSILRYTPQEFRKKIFGVDEKTTTSIYQILRTFREGTQLKKTPDLNMPISTLVKDSEKVKKLYQMLRNSRLGKKPLKKVSMPYSKVVGAAATTTTAATVEEEEEGLSEKTAGNSTFS